MHVQYRVQPALQLLNKACQLRRLDSAIQPLLVRLLRKAGDIVPQRSLKKAAVAGDISKTVAGQTHTARKRYVPRQRTAEGRLAAAAFAHDRQYFALPKSQVQPVQNLAAGGADGQSPNLNRVRRNGGIDFAPVRVLLDRVQRGQHPFARGPPALYTANPMGQAVKQKGDRLTIGHGGKQFADGQRSLPRQQTAHQHHGKRSQHPKQALEIGQRNVQPCALHAGLHRRGAVGIRPLLHHGKGGEHPQHRQILRNLIHVRRKLAVLVRLPGSVLLGLVDLLRLQHEQNPAHQQCGQSKDWMNQLQHDQRNDAAQHRTDRLGGHRPGQKLRRLFIVRRVALHPVAFLQRVRRQRTLQHCAPKLRLNPILYAIAQVVGAKTP